MPYLMSLDEGTTSCRTIIFDEHGQSIGMAQHEFKQHFPVPGWVEHDANEIRDTQFQTMREALDQSGLAAKDLSAIGITNQRETVVIWNRMVCMGGLSTTPVNSMIRECVSRSLAPQRTSGVSL